MQQKKRMHVGLWKTDTYIHTHTWDGTILRSIVACASLICTKYCFFFYRLTYFLRSRMNLTFQKLSKYILLGRAAEIISWMTYESGENSKVNSNQRTNDQSHGYSASSASFPPMQASITAWTLKISHFTTDIVIVLFNIVNISHFPYRADLYVCVYLKPLPFYHRTPQLSTTTYWGSGEASYFWITFTRNRQEQTK